MCESVDLDRFVDFMTEMLEKYGEQVLKDKAVCGIMTSKEDEKND